jgi:hypothetical protein
MEEFVQYNEQVTVLPNVVTSFREDVDKPIDWQIKQAILEHEVNTDFSSGIMAIPLSGDDYSKRVQIHELVKARVSPLDPNVHKNIANTREDVSAADLMFAEQARINAIANIFCEAKGLLNEPNGSEKTAGKRLATAGDVRSWDSAIQIASTLTGKAFDQFASGIRSVKPEWSASIRKFRKSLDKIFKADVADLGSTRISRYNTKNGSAELVPYGYRFSISAAQILKEFGSSGSHAPKNVKEKKQEENDERASRYGEKKPSTDYRRNRTGDPLDQEPELNSDEVPRDFSFETINKRPETPIEHEYAEGKFAQLVIEENLPLTVEVSGYLHRKRRSMQSGTKLRYPSRMLTDPQRRVFGNKVKAKGGIVVFDISGSMSLSQEDIESIVEAAPASVIMAYSFCGYDEPNAWIFANRGWRVKEIPNVGGSGNGVDGPAIEWAIRHRKHGEPIIWVTDGCITTAHDGTNAEIAVQCAKLVKKHKIIMIPSVGEAIRQFSSGKFTNKPSGYVRDALLGRFN